MRYVKEVTSDLKNHNGTTTLGPKTLILGGNRAGKSAIVNAIEFALTATVSDLVGRPLVKEVNRLLSLTREAGSIYARAVLDDDGVVEARSKGKKVLWSSQPDTYNPATVFPLRAVREALAGGSETTRRFFIRFVAGAVTDEDVLNEIPKPLHKRYQQLLATTPKAAAVDNLLTAMTGAKARLQALRAEIATRKDIMKEAGTGLAAPPSTQALAATEAKVVAAQDAVRRLERTLAMEQGREEKRARYTTLLAEKEEIEQGLLAAETNIANARENWPSEPGTGDEIRAHHLAVLQYAEEQNLRTCPTCKRGLEVPAEPPTAPARATFWGERVDTVSAAATAAAERVQAYEAHATLVNNLEVEIETLNHDHSKNASALEALGEMPNVLDMSDFDVRYDAAKAALEAARLEVRKLEQAKAAWEPIQRARDGAAEKEVEFDEWGRLVAALQDAIGNLLDKARDTFVARVQAFLPKGDTFGLLLRDEDREVCQYGLMRDGVLQEALSGVEWAFVTAAIAAAAIPDNEMDKLHVVVFEDRAWDLNTLRAVMQATSHLEAQVIIATTPPMDWDGNVAEGWTLIQLGDNPVADVGAYIAGGADLDDLERARHEVKRLGKELEKAWAEATAQKEINRKAGLIDEVLIREGKKVDGAEQEVVLDKPRGRRKKAEPKAPAVDPGMPPELE